MAPKYVLKNSREATVLTVFEKYHIDSTNYYYFFKKNTIIVGSKKYYLIGWIADEAICDSVFRVDIVNKYSVYIYDNILNPNFKYSLVEEIDRSDTLPYCYMKGTQHGKTEDKFLFMTYTVRGDFLFVNRIDKEILNRHMSRRFCPIQEDTPSLPFCIMIECDTIYSPSRRFLNKKKLTEFSLYKKKINYCD